MTDGVPLGAWLANYASAYGEPKPSEHEPSPATMLTELLLAEPFVVNCDDRASAEA